MSPPRSPLSDRGQGRDRAASPESHHVIVVQGLSRNVLPAHLREIFGAYGRVTGLDLPVFKVCECGCLKNADG
jgi:RNA-binding protein with serine-rich domain 1